MMAKRNVLVMVSVLLTLGLLLAGCGQSNEQASSTGEGSEGGEGETYQWRFVTEELDGQVQYEYAEEFAKRMEEKSNGKIKIEVYEFGGLGSEVNQVEQLQNGAVELAIVSPGFTGNMVKEGQIFTLHYLFPNDQEQTQKILTTSKALNEDLAKLYEEYNIKPLAFWTEGAMQWTADREIRTPDDFKNFKMRTQTSPLILESYKAYGADPTPMSWGELYTALERGTVQGQENPIFFIEDASFHEVQSHMIMSQHNNYIAMTTVNPTWYNGLPEDIRAMIEETVDELQPWVFDLQDKLNKERLEVIKNDTETPTTIIELTDEEREAFKKKALPVREYYRNEVSTVNGKILDKLQEEIEAVVNE